MILVLYHIKHLNLNELYLFYRKCFVDRIVHILKTHRNKNDKRGDRIMRQGQAADKHVLCQFQFETMNILLFGAL